MRIEIGTSWCKVSNESQKEHRFLKDYLVFEVSGAWFSKAYKNGYWDGKVRFYKERTKTFPVGLLHSTKKAAREEGFEVEVIDRRVAPCVADQSVDLSWLRPYQRTAYFHATRNKNGILWIATGGGKTEILAALVASLPTRWIFIVHRKGLMHDAAARIEKRTGIVCGKVGDGHWDMNHRVTVSTFQTLSRALKSKDPKKKKEAQILLAQQGGMVVDEAHTTGAETFWKVAMHCKNAYWRIGLSGTPLARGDKKSIYTIACLGPVIWRLRADTLIEAGFLAKPEIRMVEVEGHSSKPTWQGVYSDLIVKSQDRNHVVTKMAIAAEKPCLVFVKQVNHGKQIMKYLQRCGLNTAFVWGDKGTMQRQEAVKSLERGDLDVLVCSVIFQEGVDIPSLRSVVMAAGGKSVIATLQKIGRGMRKVEGKDTFQVFDCYDTGNEYTSKQARKRKKTYLDEHYNVTIISKEEFNAWYQRNV